MLAPSFVIRLKSFGLQSFSWFVADTSLSCAAAESYTSLDEPLQHQIQQNVFVQPSQNFSNKNTWLNKETDIWATSWENLFMPYANNKGADQPAHPRSLINTFVVRCLDGIIPLVSISEISSLYLAFVAAQAGLSLRWSQTLKTGFLVTRLI